MSFGIKFKLAISIRDLHIITKLAGKESHSKGTITNIYKVFISIHKFFILNPKTIESIRLIVTEPVTEEPAASIIAVNTNIAAKINLLSC